MKTRVYDLFFRGPCLLVFFLLSIVIGSEALAAENANFQLRKQPELQQIRPKKPVRIKLKRTAKDEYSWELTGDDVDEMIKADRKLRRQLNVQERLPAR